MDYSNVPRVPNFYRLFQLSPTSETEAIRARLLEVEAHLRNEQLEYTGEYYAEEDYRTKLIHCAHVSKALRSLSQVAQAWNVLLDEEKRAKYDALSDGIKDVWDDYQGRHDTQMNNSVSGRPIRDSALAEIYGDHVLNGTEQTPTESPTALRRSTSPAILVETGVDGCYVHAEAEQDPDEAYQFCSACLHGMHEHCWAEWRRTCADAGRALRCGFYRRVIV